MNSTSGSTYNPHILDPPLGPIWANKKVIRGLEDSWGRDRVENEAIEEAQKDNIKKERQDQDKFEKIVTKSERVLLKITSVFPFSLFPDDLIIDENKISVIYRQFFWSEAIRSVMIKNISDVIVETNPFFAKMIIVDVGFRENLIELSFMWKKEAIKARRIIQGLVVAIKEEIDISTTEDLGELVYKLEELGKAEENQ